MAPLPGQYLPVGLNPMAVSMPRPLRTAASEAQAPRWQVVIRKSCTGSSSISAARCAQCVDNACHAMALVSVSRVAWRRTRSALGRYHD